MTDDPLDAMKARWNHIQGYLFPWLREEVDPMTEALGRLVTTLDVIGLEAFVPEPPRGRPPPDDRRALARAFVAKAVLGVPTPTALIERLDVDKSLRRILGWERRSQVPSEATFSRAFAEFAQGDLPDKMHAALIERSLGGRIVGAIARDATEIEAREKPVKTEPNDKREDPPPPDGAQPTRKRGRPRKDEERPKPEPTRLERQTTQNLDQMLADLPTACDVGSKKNSKGYKETWIGSSPRKPRLGSPSSPPAASNSSSCPSTAPGLISSRDSSPSSPARCCAISASHPRRNSRTTSSPPLITSTATPSSILGPTGSTRLPDMIFEPRNR